MGALSKAMRILITGASGLVGSRLSADLAQRGHSLRLATRNPGLASQTSQDVVQIDWEDESTLSAACQDVQVVIHAAGMNVQDCTIDPCGALAANGLASAKLASAARRAGVGRLIYFSTAHVYASPLAGTITEEHCPANLHPYASSHLAGEFALRYAGQGGSMQVLVLRMSNAFGAPLNPQSNCWTLLVNDLCRQYAQKGRLQLASSGQQWRDFIPLADVCDVVARLVDGNCDFNSVGTFNLGGRPLQVIEMAELVRARVAALYGHSPAIDRPATVNLKNGMVYLNYRCDRLVSLIGPLKLDMAGEIDALLAFCMRHFHTGKNGA